MAVELSGEVKSNIVRFRDAVANSAIVKPVEDENLHITIRFLGEVNNALLGEVKENLGRLSFTKFKIHIKGVGAFPSPSSPRVIWVGIEEGGDELRKLHESVERLIGKYGVPDERGFVPHITVARVKAKGEALSKILMQWRDFEFGWQDVDKVVLKKSTLTPRGPIYENLLIVPLI